MVRNPIYEGTAIYEEIPGDRRDFRSLHPANNSGTAVLPTEREEGYVSMSNSGISNWDCITLEKVTIAIMHYITNSFKIIRREQQMKKSIWR